MSAAASEPTPPPVDAALEGAVGLPGPRPLVARFTVTGFDPSDDPDEEWVGRVVMRKDYTAGIVGSSVAEFLSSGEEPSRGYLAVERITGTLDDGRSGSFTVHHGALQDPVESSAFGYIVPGTGDGDFAGFAGNAVIVHDDDGPFFEFHLRA